MNDSLLHALDGVRVVALATNIPGPLIASRMHALGASVLKIEPPGGDALEHACPSWYAEINAGLDVRRLDLRSPDARAQLNAALADADVAITAMRASALERLGFAWPQLHAAYPRLCHVAVVGEAPPHDDRAGHDLTYQARAGLLSPPAMPRTVFADIAAGERGVAIALAALHARDRNGEGVRAGVAIVDAATDAAAPLRHGLTGAAGPLGGALPAYRLYRAADGWVAVAALEGHFVERLRAVLGVETLDADAIERALAAKTAAQWEELAGTADLPLAAVAV